MDKSTDALLNLFKKINFTSQYHKINKLNILKGLINLNRDLAPQGSVEWLNSRLYNIGGSEMSVITGDNKYSSIDQLVAQKIGFSNFQGNTATRWGKIFEHATQDITERIFDIDDGIKETGSLEGAVDNQRYSPDGLAVIKIKCGGNIGDVYLETDEYCIVLFEFKSPFLSIPCGIIPVHYLPQVKTGLCSIPVVDFAIFINNMFRKCKFDDLNMSETYDTIYHNKDHKSKVLEAQGFLPIQPLAFGLMIIYQTKEQLLKFHKTFEHLINLNSKKTQEINYDSNSDSEDDGEMFNLDNLNNEANSYDLSNSDDAKLYSFIYNRNTNAPNCSIKDLGKSYYSEFNDILKLIDDGFLSIKHCTSHILSEYNNNIFLKSQEKMPGNDDYLKTINEYNEIIKVGTINDNNIIGILPWKLIKSDIISEIRDPLYVKNYEPKIQETINIIKKINSCDSEDFKINLFKKYFPKSKILKTKEPSCNYKDFIMS